jgi:pilus assembly protein Flp/PilA
MKTLQWIKKFCADEEGVTAIEYGLIAALVAVVIIAGATLLGTNLNALFLAIAGVVGTVASAV